MSNPLTVAFDFLYSTLSGDTTFMSYVTYVGPGPAPAKTLPDFCTYGLQAAPKTLSATAVVILNRPLFQVKVSGPVSHYANISNAYDRMLTLLGLVRTSGGVLDCYITQDLYIPQVVADVQWVDLGGLFRVEL